MSDRIYEVLFIADPNLQEADVDKLTETVQGWAEKDGAFLEGPRRQVDVMVKDSKRYADTGGWGFQRFVKDTRELASAPTPQACFGCHNQLKQDGLVLSKYRE